MNGKHAAPLNGVPIFDLEPSWFNIDALFHRLWGQAVNRGYSQSEKETWHALHLLMLTRRDRG